jgi:hypothetical protein
MTAHRNDNNSNSGVGFWLYWDEPSVTSNQKELSDEQISKIADSIPVDELHVHETTWHIKFAREVIRAAKKECNNDA